MIQIRILLSLSLIIVFYSLNGQRTCGTPPRPHVIHKCIPNKIIKVGDNTYPFSYFGIRSYMKYIKQTDIDLYSKLKPDFKKLSKKRNIKIFVKSTGSVLGGVLFYKGFTTNFSQNNNNSRKQMGYIIAGFGSMISSALLSKYFNIRNVDILDFMKINNAKSNDIKMKWELSYHTDLSPGINLALIFPIK